MKKRPDELVFKEPSAVRCSCGQLCTDPATHQIHAKYCEVVIRTGVMFGALKREDFDKACPPKRRFLITNGDE